MATSADFGIPYISGTQDQPEVTHNEALNVIQALLNGAVDRGTNTPPGSPSEGDIYIIGSAPTAAWTGRANCVGIYMGTSWQFVPGDDSSGTPITIGARHEGLTVFVRDEDTFYTWNGSSWKANWLEGSATVDPGSLASMGTESHTITVTGAAMGDFAEVSHSISLGNLMAFAHVTAADTVTVRLFNPTGSPVDIGSGTMRARVNKRLT